jgi:catechol 2,3-dioxygenase-like lactoylglutathione lyase family enzyme
LPPQEVLMLGSRDAVADIAVKDLERARRFYEGILGLTLVDREGDEAVTFESGSTRFHVYRSEYAGTNQATALTWAVDDVEREVKELKAKGIEFEHYQLPGTTLKGDIHVAGDAKLAWFKDPDGNILHIMSR